MSSKISYSIDFKSPKSQLDEGFRADPGHFGKLSTVFRDQYLKSSFPKTFEFQYNLNAEKYDYETFVDLCNGKSAPELNEGFIHKILTIADAYQCSSISKPFKKYIEENCSLEEVIKFLTDDTKNATEVLPTSIIDIIASHLDEIFGNEEQKKEISNLKLKVFIAILDSPECSYPPANQLNEFILSNYLNPNSANEDQFTIVRYLNMKILTPEQVVNVKNFLDKNNIGNIIHIQIQQPSTNVEENAKAKAKQESLIKDSIEETSKLPIVLYQNEKNKAIALKEKLQKENEQNIKDITTFKQMEDLEKQVNEHNKKLQDLNSQIKKANFDPDKMNDKIREKEAEKQELDEEIKEKEIKITELQSQEKPQQEEIQNLEKQLMERQKRHQACVKVTEDLNLLDNYLKMAELKSLITKLSDFEKKKKEEENFKAQEEMLQNSTPELPPEEVLNEVESDSHLKTCTTDDPPQS